MSDWAFLSAAWISLRMLAASATSSGKQRIDVGIGARAMDAADFFPILKGAVAAEALWLTWASSCVVAMAAPKKPECVIGIVTVLLMTRSGVSARFEPSAFAVRLAT